ncbi:MAG: nucleotide sugar dehydrogenase [Candidatus Helarchaeota archaeon]
MKLLNSYKKEEIQKAIENGDVTIAIYGAGKVGLPVAVIFGDVGANVIAVDIDKELVDKINNGINPIKNEAELDERFSRCYKKGNLRASTDLVKSASEADVMIVIVPTILNEQKLMEINPLINVFENIGKGLDVGDLVILESTVPPNFTEQNIKPILEQQSNLKAGKDFGLGFSPERVFSGRIIPDIVYRYPKVVSGINQKTTNIMAALYGLIAQKGVICLSNIRTAEAMKVFEGIYRDVNIGLANELALIAEKLEIDIMELINAANTQPFSNILIPGAGVGGHCIPVYPYFILNHEEIKGLELRIIKAARQVNEYMPYHIIELLEEGLKDLQKNYESVNLTIMGLAFRGDVKEYRNSPTLIIVNYLKEKVKNLKCYDPLFSPDEIQNILGIIGVDSLENAFRDSDCLIFLTDHKLFKTLDLEKYAKYLNKNAMIIDGRQLFDPKNVIKLGIHFKGVGRKI